MCVIPTNNGDIVTHCVAVISVMFGYRGRLDN